MATGAQLREFERLDQEHTANVASVEERLGRALPRARAQLAAVLAGEGVKGGLAADITLREGFDADNPSDVLSDGERLRLPEATLVVDALGEYMDLSLSLSNQHGPQVGSYGVSPGYI